MYNGVIIWYQYKKNSGTILPLATLSDAKDAAATGNKSDLDVIYPDREEIRNWPETH